MASAPNIKASVMHQLVFAGCDLPLAGCPTATTFPVSCAWEGRKNKPTLGHLHKKRHPRCTDACRVAADEICTACTQGPYVEWQLVNCAKTSARG